MITIERNALLKHLQLISGVVEKKQGALFSSNVLFELIDPTTLCMTATDLEVELKACLPLTESSAFERITLPARKLIDLCRALPEDAVLTVKLNDGKAQITSGRSRFALAILPATDFPIIALDENEAEFSIQQGDLRYVIEKTYFCMAQQDVRYFLNGLLLDLQPGILRGVATNGHRLAVSTLPQTSSKALQLQVIVPRKGVLELLHLLDASDTMVDVSFTKNHIQVQTPNITFISKLIDGRFPNYERILPKTGDKKIVLDREALKQLLMRVSVLANEKYRGVRFQLRQNLLRISANNPEQEEAVEELEIEYAGSDLDIGFNVSYLIDILTSIELPMVQFTFSDSNSGVLVESIPNEENAYVVMPMRL